MQHLCSRTLRPSHTESFVESWTSYLEASRASPSVLRESVKALKTRATCSHTSPTESESADLDLFSWRTSKESSQAKPQTESRFSSMSSANWKAWVTEQRQEYSQRLKSAHLTKESGCSSWPTATVFDTTGGSYPTEMVNGVYRSKHSQDPDSPWYGAKLKDAVESHEAKQNWLTPRASEPCEKPGQVATRLKDRGEHCHGSLSGQVAELKNWPTPNASDEQTYTMKESGSQASRSLSSMAVQGKLSPQKNWTTPTCHMAKEGGFPAEYTRNTPTLTAQASGPPTPEKSNTTGKSQGSWPTPDCSDRRSKNSKQQGLTNKATENKTNTKLNPNWVEQLMGLPVGWTDLGSWATE